MKKFDAIIVDDEELARFELNYMLGEYNEINVIGKTDSIYSTIQLIKDKKPDLIFLDIQLGNENGFDLFDRANVNAHVIFVTAYDEYAVRAFEVNALDYLLKPVNDKRLKTAINRFMEMKNLNRSGGKLGYGDRIFINTNRNMKFVALDSIVCICAEGDYSVIHTLNREQLATLKSLKDWENSLPEIHFTRIHRSLIININYVEHIEPIYQKSYQVHMKNNNKTLTMSKRYASKLRNKFKL